MSEIISASVPAKLKQQVLEMAEKENCNQSEIIRRAVRFYGQTRLYSKPKASYSEDKLVTREESALVGFINRIRYGKRKPKQSS